MFRLHVNINERAEMLGTMQYGITMTQGWDSVKIQDSRFSRTPDVIAYIHILMARNSSDYYMSQVHSVVSSHISLETYLWIYFFL